ncbi:MAG: pyruvate formate lyase family protein [Pseudomonadota bacterium]|nr:pyruvate formate lyase family protein [Pseudomonadota bacterium]
MQSSNSANLNELDAIGVIPINKEWGIGVSGVENPSPFSRTNQILKRWRETKWSVDHERAALLTQAYKKYAGLSQQLKSASALAHILKNVTIRIYPDELIVGEIGAPAKAAPVYPEFSFGWVQQELKDNPFKDRPYTAHATSEETEKELLEIGDFWNGKTVEDEAISLFTEDQIKATHLGKAVFSLQLYLHGGIGHTHPNFKEVLNLGYGGLQEKIQQKYDACDNSLPDDIKKREFYQSQLIVIDGMIEYCNRYARLAMNEAKGATGERRKELVKIAEICSHIATGVPRSLWEAAQLMQFTYNLVMIESNGHSVSYGRMDQDLYPFYKKDLENGVAKEWQQEMLESLFLKWAEMCKLRDWGTVAVNGGHGMGGTTITIGGSQPDGSDATNDLSYMMVDAIVHTRLGEPWLAVRWHKNTPRNFKIKCANAIRVGFGRPKLFNDEVCIPSMARYGRSLEDAKNYGVVGCVEIDAPGKEYGWHDAAYFSMPKILELALNNGRCFECESVGKDLCPRYSICAAQGKRLGLETGSLAEFSSFDEVKAAYDRQMQYMCDLMVGAINATDIAHQRRRPLPGLSLLIEGCTEKGIDVSAGGAIYNYSGPQAVGVGTVADGLAAIKQLVFDEKKVTGKEFLTALLSNWEGYEWLHALVNSEKVHHYGNDDAYADELAVFGSDTYCKHVENRPTAHGGVFLPGVYSVTANVGLGLILWASPDGRKAQEPISDNCGAVHNKAGSHDVQGPTAMLKSVCKLDHERMGNGTLLNMKYSPTSVSGDSGRDNFIDMVDSYFSMGGLHCQFNILSKETLEDAYENPAEHENLLVRVAGYSAFFNDLSVPTKLDIMDRTELSFD